MRARSAILAFQLFSISVVSRAQVVQHPLGNPLLPVQVECIKLPDGINPADAAQALGLSEDVQPWIEEFDELEDESEIDRTSWMQPPAPNASGHHLFNSVASLLQLWPNTLWPTGRYLICAGSWNIG